eukprot:TRINITY_DN2894_c0_g1_i1.p1 TRINITY_DN2894_c0_g1~~TRINITY_DN2894_c0_g1_i1.p1  ORF type:complete len:403 (+),score=97.84 TRINITY_DN2894_c0_g1_i1:219-1427(+)
MASPELRTVLFVVQLLVVAAATIIVLDAVASYVSAPVTLVPIINVLQNNVQGGGAANAGNDKTKELSHFSTSGSLRDKLPWRKWESQDVEWLSGQLCGWSEGFVFQRMEEMRKDSGSNEMDVVYLGSDGSWQTSEGLKNASVILKSQGKEKEVCLLALIKAGLMPTRDHCSLLLPFNIRLGTSDVDVLESIILRQLYRPLERLTDGYIQGSLSVQSVFDAGADIGISPVVLSLMFPNARILAVEADRRKLALCKKNTQWLPHVQMLHAVITPRVVDLASLTDTVEAGPNNGNQASSDSAPCKSRPCPEAYRRMAGGDARMGLSVPFLLDTFGLKELDYLKLGYANKDAEKIVEAAENSWASRVKLISMHLEEEWKENDSSLEVNGWKGKRASGGLLLLWQGT